jgi:hypothetical protein
MTRHAKNLLKKHRKKKDEKEKEKVWRVEHIIPYCQWENKKQLSDPMLRLKFFLV